MSEEVKRLLEELLVLPPKERAELANSLLESLETRLLDAPRSVIATTDDRG